MKDGVALAISDTDRAKLAIFLAGAAWGVFWIPLRWLASTGLDPIWVTPVYFLFPCLLVLPILIRRRSAIAKGGFGLLLTMIASGSALSLYSSSIIFTDVVRALLLFYLMPVWSAVLARIFLGEKITLLRYLAMGMAALGMLTIFGLGLEFPVPRNLGDWMGLSAGLLWAIAMVRIRSDESYAAIDLTVGFFFSGLVFAVIMAIAFSGLSVPRFEFDIYVVFGILIFSVLVMIPGTFASLWGPKFLNPGVAGLLFMSEIVVGVITAAILTDEHFGMRELVGVLLIAAASLVEPLAGLFSRRKTAQTGADE